MIGAIKAIAEALKEPLSALGDWLNPTKREIRVLRNCIIAARNIIEILEKDGKYKDMTDADRLKWRIHFQKQFDNWQDGQG